MRRPFRLAEWKRGSCAKERAEALGNGLPVRHRSELRRQLTQMIAAKHANNGNSGRERVQKEAKNKQTRRGRRRQISRRLGTRQVQRARSTKAKPPVAPEWYVYGSSLRCMNQWGGPRREQRVPQPQARCPGPVAQEGPQQASKSESVS